MSNLLHGGSGGIKRRTVTPGVFVFFRTLKNSALRRTVTTADFVFFGLSRTVLYVEQYTAVLDRVFTLN